MAQSLKKKPVKMIMPLPYSAFPEELALYVGAITVAYQRLEDEVPQLIRNIVPFDPDILDVFIARTWQISGRLQLIEELVPLCVEDTDERGRLVQLVKRIKDVGTARNAIMHSATHAFNKQTGEILQVNKRRKASHVATLGEREFRTVVNRHYLILECFDQRQAGVEDWIEPLFCWDKPERYW